MLFLYVSTQVLETTVCTENPTEWIIPSALILTCCLNYKQITVTFCTFVEINSVMIYVSTSRHSVSIKISVKHTHNTHIYFLMVSVDQKSRHRLTGSSAQGVTGKNVGVHQATNSSEAYRPLPNSCGCSRIYLLVVAGLRFLQPSRQSPGDCSQLSEATRPTFLSPWLPPPSKPTMEIPPWGPNSCHTLNITRKSPVSPAFVKKM